MNYFECPYCKRKASSSLDLGNSLYIFNTDKKCGHCFGRVRLNIFSYFSAYIFTIAYFIIGLIVIEKMHEPFARYAFYFLIASLLIGQFFIPYFLSKCFRLRLLLPKDNVEEYIGKIPDILKYDPKDMPKVNVSGALSILIIFVLLIWVSIYFLN